MKRTVMYVFLVMFLAFMCGIGTAGDPTPPGPPSGGSGMPSLLDIFNYLVYGTPAPAPGDFKEPATAPGTGTMKNLKEIYEAVATPFPECNAAAADVAQGKKFFSTQSGSWGVREGTGSGGGGGVPATGQTTSTETGDDGHYRMGVAVLVPNEDGLTVTDSRTGLMWPKDPTGAGYNGGVSLNWPCAVAWANELDFAGNTDWRLPNVNELKSYQEVTWGHYQGRTTSIYWSSTTDADNILANALCVIFNCGGVGNASQDDAYFVVAVRGGVSVWTPLPTPTPCTPPSLWYDCYGPDGSGDVVLIGSMYVASNCYGRGCAGGVVKSWVNADSWALNLHWLGKSTGWRLPTTEELSSICAVKDTEPGFTYQSSVYWSVGDYYYGEELGYAAGIWFHEPPTDCEQGSLDESGKFFMRAVRDVE